MTYRIKERGGASAKIMASNPHKTLTPTDNSTPKIKPLNRRAPAAAATKQSSLAIPSVRWSTSSLPQGKSPNPSDLNPRATKVEKVVSFTLNSKKISENKEVKRNKENVVNKSVDDVIKLFNSNAKSMPRTDNAVNKGGFLNKCGNGDVKSKEISSDSKVEEKDLELVKVFENPRSKLHDKLAALEGRVQRIAFDIKRTKEMLDLNKDQSESKLILYDIQKKISGIEKAVGSVMDGEGSELGLSEILKDPKVQTEGCSNGGAVKGLKIEELEARFFPHQKLIKNRTVLESKSELVKPKGSMSPIDENPIALEFLASLGTDQNEMKMTSRGIKSELIGVQKMGTEGTSSGESYGSSKGVSLQCNEEMALVADEKLDDFDHQENKQAMVVFEEAEDSYKTQMCEIGRKSSTGGWFVSEGEAVLLTHSDGSCSYYDIANSEEKAEYKPPQGVSNNLWSDCWLIHATGADGSSGRFVVAASAGSTLESGFCSWDFHTRSVQSFRVEDGTPNSSLVPSSRTALAPLSNTALLRRSASCTMPTVESRQWWYRPCGPLLISTASKQKNVSAYDIRDGEVMLKWEVNSPVIEMEYSSPLQWRSRGKVVVAQSEAISLWDVNSLTPQPLLSVSSCGKKICCLHVNNTDAEIGGGVRQRARSSEVEGNDGVFCCQDSINVFDFRIPSGVGLKISRQGANAQSIFSCGDYLFIGSTDTRFPLKTGSQSHVQQFSLRKGKLMATYALPESNSHFHHSSVTQVWGNSSLVMGINGTGLSVFDAFEDESMHSFNTNCGNTVEVKETIGSDDLYCPTFDYLGSRVLVISRDRPAMWRYLL